MPTTMLTPVARRPPVFAPAQQGPVSAPRAAPAPASRQLDFTVVVRDHQEPLYRRAMWLTRQQSDAWDLVQMTFERAMRALRHPVEPDMIRRWLLVIMHNSFLDQGRSFLIRRGHALTDEMLGKLPAPETDDEPSWRDFDPEQIRACAAQLPEPLQQTFAAALQGLTMAQIAARLGAPIGTICSRIHRSRRRIREMLLPS